MSFALPNCVTQANASDVEKQGGLALAHSDQVDCSALHDFTPYTPASTFNFAGEFKTTKD